MSLWRTWAASIGAMWLAWAAFQAVHYGHDRAVYVALFVFIGLMALVFALRPKP